MGTTSLSIKPPPPSGSNQIGLFDSHSNSNGTGAIFDQTLTTPINIVDEPLPVELKSFNAKVTGSNVELLWQTATEVNNYGFEIERKANDNESASWEKVGFVAANGNSNSPKDYTFVDKNITGGSKILIQVKAN